MVVTQLLTSLLCGCAGESRLSLLFQVLESLTEQLPHMVVLKVFTLVFSMPKVIFGLVLSCCHGSPIGEGLGAECMQSTVTSFLAISVLHPRCPMPRLTNLMLNLHVKRA